MSTHLTFLGLNTLFVFYYRKRRRSERGRFVLQHNTIPFCVLFGDEHLYEGKIYKYDENG